MSQLAKSIEADDQPNLSAEIEKDLKGENSRNGNLRTLRRECVRIQLRTGRCLPLACSATSAYAPARASNVI
jgi:hypothetical protein